MFIKNFDNLAKTPNRKIVLELIEAALSSIQPEEVINKNVKLENNKLFINDKTFNIENFDRIFLLGFGKGSAKNSKLIEGKLGGKLTEGFVIDTNSENFAKIKFTQGAHPLPSQQNVEFTDSVIKRFKDLNLTERDLVIIVVCGGGSAMLVHPYRISLEKKIEVGKALLESGADIIEMNTIRKHLSTVKGGGLSEILYPSNIATLIFSDVPGNDLSFIASGPTVKDHTTVDDAIELLEKYNLWEKLELTREEFSENPKDDKYFENVSNLLILSNLTALSAMQKKAQELGLKAEIFSDKFQGIAREVGKELVEKTSDNSVLLVGGETTVKVKGEHGQGGRNQELVLATLQFLNEKTVISSFDSDGWDNSRFAGAFGDHKTIERANELGVEPLKFLETDNSLEFFEKTGDGIETGRLPSNVSDLIIILKIKD
ncbi:MAG: DUF4147 domain-containing protein [Candidatus Levybacteria bacterium]|nr:DUF4147 domain-containing protein [Candidatus Levybacteria bacterium]